MRIVKLLNCYIPLRSPSFWGQVVTLLIVLALTSCGKMTSGEVGVFEGLNGEVQGGTENQVDGVEPRETNQVVFSLDIDGDIKEVEMPGQERFTAFDVLSFYTDKEGIELKTKKYDFGMFVEGIGDKIGDVDSFWLFYVNGGLANASVDNVEVRPGDVIRFEFTGSSPF